jgi:hypothetical protein
MEDSDSQPGEGTFEVKGTGVAGVVGFVRETFGDEGFQRWLAALSPQARAVAESPILVSSWYPGAIAMELRNAIVELFFAGDKSRMTAVGKFTGEKALTGVYKLAIRIGSPRWVISRIGMVYETFYRPGKISLPVYETKRVVVRLTGFPDKTGVMEHIFAGFLRMAVELSGAKDITTTILKATSRGDPVSEVEVQWA